MSDDLMVAMDTGGSKTRLVLVRPDGVRIAERTGPGVGAADDPVETPLPALMDAIQALMEGMESGRVGAVTANLGGKNAGQLLRALEGGFPAARIRVFRESSGVLANVLREETGSDAILLAGTGLLALARGPSGFFLADGWGRDIGDAGSGYWIGMQAVSRALTALEKNEALPDFAKRITARGAPFAAAKDAGELMKCRDAVRSGLLPLGRAKAAGYVPLVCQSARRGDGRARAILVDAGAMMAQAAIRALGGAGLARSCRVLVIGGLVHCADLWGSSFEAALRAAFPAAAWQADARDLTAGAVAYMRRRGGETAT